MNLKAIEKSRKLLVQVMGQSDFDKFIEDGKIEIKHDDITYELDQDARVFNKTKGESYCVEPICPGNLPLHDQLAIKFAYLKNNIKRVEEVANKRSTSPVRQIHMGFQGLRENGNLRLRFADTNDNEVTTRQSRYGQMEASCCIGVGYDSYIDYMEGLGWTREQLTLGKYHTNLVNLSSVNVGNTGAVIDIQCPIEMKISIIGTQQIPRDADDHMAHSLRARFADEENNEIPTTTKIRITKEKTSDAVIQLARVFYGDINATMSPMSSNMLTRFKTYEQWFRFESGIELSQGDHLRLYAINTDLDSRNISSTNSGFTLECDLWSRL